MTRLGAFVLETRLARGGLGEVWRGRHEASGVPVAVKVLHRALDPAARQDFADEVRVLAALHHPAIVPIHEAGEVDAPTAERLGCTVNAPWLALDLASGGSLAERPPASWHALRPALVRVLEGLAHAHARGIVHRDLKPGNVLVFTEADRSAGVRITDFGLAHRHGRRDTRRVGSVYTIAPEQLRGAWRELGPWTDLYALGCMTAHLVYGLPPFDGSTVSEVARAHLEGRRRPLVGPRFDIPTDLVAWLDWLLAFHPQDRPDRAADALHALPGSAVAEGEGAAMASALNTSTVDLWALDEPTPARPSPTPRTAEGALREVPDHDDPGLALPAALCNTGLGLFAHRVLPVVGRAEVQQALWERLRRAAGSVRPVGVCIVGPPGSGRTRLGRWLAHRAHELGVADVFLVPAGTEEPARALLDSHGADGDLRGWLATRRSPRVAVLCVEDTRRGAPGRELARDLLRRGIGRQLLVVSCAERPDQAIGEPIALPPLARADQRLFLRELLGLDPELAMVLEEHTDGNPGFARAIVEAWARRGVLEPGPRGLRRVPGAELTPPQDVADAWRQRLEDLDPELQALLERAAALGRRPRDAELEALTQRPPRDPAWAVLTEAGLVERDQDGYRFASTALHAVVRAHAHARGTWRPLRCAVAQHRRALRPERWVHARLDGDGIDGVLPALYTVDDRRGNLGNEACMALLDQCEALLVDAGRDHPSVPWDLLRFLKAQQHLYQGRIEPAATLLDAVEADTDDPTLRDRIATERVHVLLYQRRFEEVIAAVEARLARGVLPHRPWELLAHRAMALRQLGRPCREAYEAVLEAGPPARSPVLRGLAWAHDIEGDPDAARAWAERAIAAARAEGGDDLGRALADSGVLAMKRGDLELALSQCEEAHAILRTAGMSGQVYAGFNAALARRGVHRTDIHALEALARDAADWGIPLIAAGTAALLCEAQARVDAWDEVARHALSAGALVDLGETEPHLADALDRAGRRARDAGHTDLATRLEEIAAAMWPR